jgi:hypothetical protein
MTTTDPFVLGNELLRLYAAGEIDGPEAVRKLDANGREVDAFMKGAAAALNAATTRAEIEQASAHYVAAAQLRVKQASAALTLAVEVYGSEEASEAADAVLAAVAMDVEESNASSDWKVKALALFRARARLEAAIGPPA